MVGRINVDGADNVETVTSSINFNYLFFQKLAKIMLPLSRLATRLASWAPLQQPHLPLQQAQLMSSTTGQMAMSMFPV